MSGSYSAEFRRRRRALEGARVNGGGSPLVRRREAAAGEKSGAPTPVLYHHSPSILKGGREKSRMDVRSAPKQLRFDETYAFEKSIGATVPKFHTEHAPNRQDRDEEESLLSYADRGRERIGETAFSKSEPKLRRGRSISPPPPPPPPLPREQQQQEERRGRANQQNKPSVGMNNMKRYAAKISSNAQRHRKTLLERSSRTLMDKVESLQGELSRHIENERKLQDINKRLQDRLVLFQQQNRENVVIAKKRIGELEQELEVQKAHSARKSSPVRRTRTHSPRKHFSERHANRSQNITQRIATSPRRQILGARAQERLERKARESKAKVLRAWACQVLLRKICGRAKRRRAARRALRCWEAWKLYIENKRQERHLLEWADTYFEQVVFLRRVLQSWRCAVTEKRRSRDERVTNDAGPIFGVAFHIWRERARLHRLARLCRTFGAWRLYVARINKARMERYEAMYLLMPTESRFISTNRSSIHTKK